MIITMNGRYGCGSRLIAAKAAKLLGYRLCDDEIVLETVKNMDVDMSEEAFRYYDESTGTADVREIKRQSSVDRNRQGIFSIISGLQNDVPPLDKSLSKVVRQVIDKLAEDGNCILFGRGTNSYLRSRPDAVHFFVTSAFDKRVNYLCQLHPEVERADMEKLVTRTDKRREEYCYFFSGERWDDPEHYDLVIKTELLHPDGWAEIVRDIVTVREKVLKA